MKVLLIGPLPPPVGGVTVLFELLVEETASSADKEVQVINFSRGSYGGKIKQVTRALTSTLKMFSAIPQSDIVALNGPDRRLVLQGIWIYLLTRFYRKPLILRPIGGSFDLYYTRGTWLLRALIARVFRAECILLETRHLYDFFSHLFPKAHLVFFPNSRRQAEPHAGDLPKGPARRFVFISHVKPAKGVLDILEAAGRLQGTGWTIDIYGPLLDGVQAIDFEGRPGITYCGQLAPEAVIPTLQQYDMLLLPTYWEGEGYPGIILEAYMAGIPVIVSNWRSLPEIVEDGVSGLIVEAKDPKGLAAAMQRVMDDPALMTTLRTGARKQAGFFDSKRWNRDMFTEVCNNLLQRA